MIVHLVKNIFGKIFNNLAKEFSVSVPEIQLGIQFNNGSHSYEAYKNFEFQKKINLNDYCGSSIGLDLTGGVQGIDMLIGQSGTRYAKELNCATDVIQVIMAHREKDLPIAILLKNGEKVRKINILSEFF